MAPAPSKRLGFTDPSSLDPSTLANFCKSKKCITFNVCYHQGSKKLKFDMNLIRHSPFKTYFLVIKRVFTSSSSHKFSLLVLAPVPSKKAWLLASAPKHYQKFILFLSYYHQILFFWFYNSSY